MRETALSAMEERGLAEHQFYLVEHTDEPHKHVHIVANLVHPETGKINNCYKDRDVLDSWANEYEKQHGIQCENRAAKYEAWEQDRAAFPDRTKKLDHREAVTTAFERSDNGRSFQAALAEEGLTLARGRRRAFVVVDQNGDVSNLSKVIDFTDGTKGRAKTAKIREHLKDVAPDDLFDADSVAQQALERGQRDVDGGDEDGGDDGQQVAEGGGSASQKRSEETPQEEPDIRPEDQAASSKAAFLKAAKAKAEDERKALEKKAVAEEQKRQAQEAATALKQRAEQQRRRWEKYQAELVQKTAASRVKWQIDELTAKQEAAQERVESLSGFWSRVFKPFQRREALEQLENVSLQLQERTTRFDADVAAFKREEPARGLEEVQREDSALKRASRAGPASSQAPPPPHALPSQPDLSAEQRKSAEKQAFLKRERGLREGREDEQDQKPDLERE